MGIKGMKWFIYESVQANMGERDSAEKNSRFCEGCGIINANTGAAGAEMRKR